MPIKSPADSAPQAPALRRLVRDAERFLTAQDLNGAEKAAVCALAMDPDDAQALRSFARVQILRGRPADAVAALQRALVRRPDAVDTLLELGQAQAANGTLEDAIATLRRAVALKPDAANWFELGLMLDRNADCADALDAARRVAQMAPRRYAARFLIARALTGLGRISEAAEEYRQLTAIGSESAKAWFGLTDLKTVALDDGDIAAMETLAADRRNGESDRILAGFAAGLACETRGRPADAMAHFRRANQLRRKSITWDTAAHGRYCDSIRAAFDAPHASAPAQLGEQVIFIVGMPRSGTTLVEQMLSAHPDVVGASELPHLSTVIQEESARRGQAFPRWVGAASAADWERLGQRYLQLTERWQAARRFTDKLPENWPYVGAALAMLPGARVIGCERDLVETCWSCYKQLFAPNRVAYSYDFDELAGYAHDSRRLWAWWRQRYPQHCRTLVYETLLASPEAEIRSLLDFCGLPFDTACLSSQDSPRVTRTASAAQVRQPLSRTTARGDRYGELFSPLRDALARAADHSWQSALPGVP